MLLSDWLALAERRLSVAGVDSARLEAQMLAAHVLLVDRSWVLAHPAHEFPELAGESVLQRREAREPLAYVLGWREFYDRRFVVRPGVLIPRQETETLVDVALAEGRGPRGSGSEEPDLSHRSDLSDLSQPPTPYPLSVLDLGTGSGILAVTLKLERPNWQVTAADISLEALEIARENAGNLGAEVRFILSDGFVGLKGERFDLIVTNPPYVAQGAELMPEVGEHEPDVALYSGQSGLEFYELLAREGGDHLTSGGRLITELGDGIAGAVAALFRRAGWTVDRRVNDLLGIERCLVLSPESTPEGKQPTTAGR